MAYEWRKLFPFPWPVGNRLGALAALGFFTAAFYAPAMPGADDPRLVPMRSLTTAETLEAPSDLTDTRGLVPQKVYRLETRSFPAKGGFSLLFLPAGYRSITPTVIVRGLLRIGLDSHAPPGVFVESTQATQATQGLRQVPVESVATSPPSKMPREGVLLRFIPSPETLAGRPGQGEGGASRGDQILVHLGRDKAYRAFVPLKSGMELLIASRDAEPPFSSLFLLDDEGGKVPVYIPGLAGRFGWGTRGLFFLLALAILTFLPASEASVKHPSRQRKKSTEGLFQHPALGWGVGGLTLALSLLIFLLPASSSTTIGAFGVLCAFLIFAFSRLNSPVPFFMLPAPLALLVYFAPVPATIPASACAAMIFASFCVTLRRRRDIPSAQFLLPILALALIVSLELHQRSKGAWEHGDDPLTGSRIDTWMIASHTDLLGNHENLEGESFRGGFAPYKKKEGELRLIALGSSSTYGAGIGDPARCWPAQLEAILAESCRGPLKVINAGWGGYNSHQLAIWLDEVLWRYNPDGLLFYYGGNEDGDRRPESYHAHMLKEMRRLGNPDIRERERVLRYGTGRPAWLATLDRLAGLATYRLMRKALVKSAPSFHVDESQATTTITHSLNIMRQTALTRDFTLILIPELDISPGHGPVRTVKPHITKKMEAFAARHDLPVFDLAGPWEKVKNEAVALDAVHMTPLGAGHLARFIAEELLTLPFMASACGDS